MIGNCFYQRYRWYNHGNDTAIWYLLYFYLIFLTLRSGIAHSGELGLDIEPMRGRLGNPQATIVCIQENGLIVGDGLEAGFVLLTAGALPPKSPNFKRASRWLVSNTPPVGRFGQSRFFKIPPMKIKGHCVPWAPSKQTHHICLLQCIFQRGSTKPWEN